MRQRISYNPKRKISPVDAMAKEERLKLAKRSRYGGNPEHKRSPGDYDLTPPASPRPGKTVCDASDTPSKADATELLARGFEKGMFSIRLSNGWPQNVWAVSDAGEAFESQLENRDQGIYHGYPLPIDDDFRKSVLEEWNRR